MFGRATITLGIGPHSSLNLSNETMRNTGGLFGEASVRWATFSSPTRHEASLHACKLLVYHLNKHHACIAYTSSEWCLALALAT